MLPMVPMLDHQPICKASGRAALWPVMEGWRGRQCHFSIVPARLSSVLMEEEAFTGCRLPPEEPLTQFLRTQFIPAGTRLWELSPCFWLSAVTAQLRKAQLCLHKVSAEDLRVLLKQFYPILQRKEMAHRVPEWQFKTTQKQSGAHPLPTLDKTQSLLCSFYLN